MKDGCICSTPDVSILEIALPHLIECARTNVRQLRYWWCWKPAGRQCSAVTQGRLNIYHGLTVLLLLCSRSLHGL